MLMRHHCHAMLQNIARSHLPFFSDIIRSTLPLAVEYVNPCRVHHHNGSAQIAQPISGLCNIHSANHHNMFMVVMISVYKEIKITGFQNPLTHWGRDKMAIIFQTTFSNAFSLMKMDEFRLRFHQSLFPRFQLTIFQHWFRQWLGAVQATSHYLNQWRLVYWHIYASLGLSELTFGLRNHCSVMLTLHLMIPGGPLLTWIKLNPGMDK